MKAKLNIAAIIGRVLLIIVITLVMVVVTILGGMKLICGGTSPAAKKMFVTTLLETGQMKGFASLFLSAEEIQALVDSNTMEAFNEEVDTSLIHIDVAQKSDDGSAEGGDTGENIEIVEISGRTFYANMMIVKDPSTVSVSTIYPWRDTGDTLDQIVKNAGAVAGVNGGIYNSNNNSGGMPFGVVVSNGEVQYNNNNGLEGLVLIGLTDDNLLQIIDVNGKSAAEIETIIADNHIRDAVTFQEESTDKNNHFVQLVINGEAREMNGLGSGLNPRTVIGQRADGAILFLVTDGRGKSGHLGASASDLIDVMLEYGAVNAANLDGGSSSCMYYQDDYLMTSVTFYYSNASWRMPLAFVVK